MRTNTNGGITMHPNIALSLIVAMTPGRVIGLDNNIPWRLPSDMARFKEITIREGVVVMGRKTWESLPRKFQPLPDRHNIILTKTFPGQLLMPSVESVASVEDALEVIRTHGGHACIIGGAQIYKLFMPLVQKAYITTVHAAIGGDTFFPQMRDPSWRQMDASPIRKHPGDEHPTSFHIYERATG